MQNDNITVVVGAFLGTAVGFLSDTCWGVGAGGFWGWGFLCLAVLWDGLVWGIQGCICINVAFVASDWLVLRYGGFFHTSRNFMVVLFHT